MVSNPLQPSLDIRVGLYENAYDNKGSQDGILVEEVISRIKGSEFATITESLRSLSGAAFENYKKSMFPAVGWSGIFSPTRSKGNLRSHSGLLCLDIDKLSGLALANAKLKILADPFTFICFISPSGKGLKVVVRLELLDKDHHEFFFSQLTAYYKEHFGIMLDSSGSDVSRLCFLPHDPEIFVNMGSQEFALEEAALVPTAEIKHLPPERSKPLIKAQDEEIFAWCIRIHNRKHEFIEGNRNHYLTALANFCNDYGVSKDYCEAECLSRFTQANFKEKEIKDTIKSVYMKVEQHGYKTYNPALDSEATIELSTTDINSVDEEESMAMTTPNIPPSIYNLLPDLLQRMVKAFQTDWERDTFLTSVLIVLSGCFPTVSGSYGRARVFPNLFGFIVAPAASGKGAMAWAKRIAEGYHKKKKESFSDCQNCQDEPEMGGDLNSQIPDMLFLPANSSGAGLIQALQNNNGQGIIFETEADTLSATFKQDWGNFSDMLRKGFHHEPISSLRKQDRGVLIEIDKPKFSVCLSGTPAQVQRLIPNAEDGLFSRFVYFSFEAPVVWRSVGPDPDQVDLDEHFESFQAEITGLAEAMEGLGPVKFDLQKHQWDDLDDTFKDYLAIVNQTFGGNAVGSVKRLGLITFRIAMILSILRKYESGEVFDKIICNDTDFTTAMELGHVYLQHMISVYSKLPQESVLVKNKAEAKVQRNQEIQRLLELGHSKRETARFLGITDGTVRNVLKEGA